MLNPKVGEQWFHKNDCSSSFRSLKSLCLLCKCTNCKIRFPIMKPCVLSFGALAVTFVTLRWFTVKVDAGLAEANLVNNEVKVIRTGIGTFFASCIVL